MVTFPIRSLPFSLLALVAACTAPNTSLDLASNERLYQDITYATRVPGDRALFVAPLADTRKIEGLPLQDDGCPILYGNDQVWDRPVRDMVDEVLARQVQDSGLFAGVSDKAAPENLVLMPSLESFTTGAIERVTGAQSFAEVALRVKVFGPVDAAGQRSVLLDTVYADRQITPTTMKPVSPYLLVGGALRTAVQKTLAGLDGSNVGRSFVPTEVAAPLGQ